MLKLQKITAGYNKIPAIMDISFTINPGEIVSLIGANGAGKSTILKTISGLITPLEGKIFFQDKEISKLAIHKIVELGIILCPEGRQVFSSLTVKENLLMGAYTKSKIDHQQLEFIYTTFPLLKKRLNQYAGTLSGGEQQMLAIGRSLMAKPQILLLDEPSLGLAPVITKELFSVINLINQTTKIAIILVEQNATLALKHSNRGYVIKSGNLVLSGNSSELLNSSAIKQAYLGEIN
ncbi:MAG: ABC transporter ATP-binding protein [Burkholderiales bacterium]|jgi:branched-chain amino acid transport system ATP-binding protein|nr:ABC transporter ATP-binding protein [Burkholderiales bacterium]